MFIILNHYGNEDIGEFGKVSVPGYYYAEQANAIAAADAMLQDDQENGIERDTIPVAEEDLSFLEMGCDPVYVAGVQDPHNPDRYHNIYMVLEVNEGR